MLEEESAKGRRGPYLRNQESPTYNVRNIMKGDARRRP